MLDREAVGVGPVSEVPVNFDCVGCREHHVQGCLAGCGSRLDLDLETRSPRRGSGDQKCGNNDQTAAHARRIFSCWGLPETATAIAIALNAPWTIIPG